MNSNLTSEIIDKINSINDHSELTTSNVASLVGCSDSQVRRRAGGVLKERKAELKSSEKAKAKEKVKPINVDSDNKYFDLILTKLTSLEKEFKALKKEVKQGDWIEYDYDTNRYNSDRVMVKYESGETSQGYWRDISDDISYNPPKYSIHAESHSIPGHADYDPSHEGFDHERDIEEFNYIVQYKILSTGDK